MTAAEVPAEGQTIDGKYVVERRLGAGGMGVVVAARHLQLGHRVAIKLVHGTLARDEQATARFVREARAAVALKSEHVARVLDVGSLEGGGAPYIVMEYLVGSDLSEVLRRDGPMPIEMAAGYVLQACEAVAEAHALGIVHRDLKPSNLFATPRIDGSIQIKVLDFGICKIAGSNSNAGPSVQLTSQGTIMGSPAYMSPEQVVDSSDVDARSDVWSLGVILYELLTGQSPFAADAVGATFARILSGVVTPLQQLRADVPEPFSAIVHRCMERRREARVQSVAELAAVLVVYAPQEVHSARAVERISGIASGRTASVGGTPSAGRTMTAGNLGMFSGTKASGGSVRALTQEPGASPALLDPRSPGKTLGHALRSTGVLFASAVVLCGVVFGRRFREWTTPHVTTPSTSPPSTRPEPTSSVRSTPPLEGAPPRVARAGLLLFDADADGTPDVVDVFERAGEDVAAAAWLGAVSGADGHPLWRSAVPAEAIDRGMRVLVGSTLLVLPDARSVPPDRALLAIDARNGRTLWRRNVETTFDALCASENDVGLRVDGSWLRFVVETGEPSHATGACGRVYSSNVEGSNFDVAEGADAEHAAGSAAALTAAKLHVERALIPVTGSARVLLCDAQPTGEAAVAVVANGRLLWRALLGQPGAAPARWSLARAAVRHQHVVVPYRAGASVHVTAFDLSKGARLWDVVLAGEADAVDSVVASTEGDAAFIRTTRGHVWSISSGGQDVRRIVGED